MNDTSNLPHTPCSPPRVSVVMATYNYDKYISQSIQSLIDQTYSNWELIIVDDGSSDNTAQVVQQFLSDERVNYFQQENHGASHARNVAIRRARGDLIAFLDADDAWLPTKLAKQVQLFDHDPELGVAYTERHLMDPEGNVTGGERREMLRGNVLGQAIKRTIPPFSSAMVRSSVLDDVGLFDESLPLASDYELWLRVALNYRFDYVDEPLLLYRTGHANLSRRSTERRNLVLDVILPRFLAREGVAEHLGTRAIAEAYADTYINQAIEARHSSVLRALPYHLKALRTSPWMWISWRSAMRCCVPDNVVNALKNTVLRHHHN